MKSKNLVFLSIFDNKTDLSTFLKEDRKDYDVVALYYGLKENRFEKLSNKVNYIEKAGDGSIYSNFIDLWDRLDFSKYENVYFINDNLYDKIDVPLPKSVVIGWSFTCENMIKKQKQYTPKNIEPFKWSIDFEKNKKDKIAFLFLTTEDIHRPQHWHDFLDEGKDRATLYAHSKYQDRLKNQYLIDAQIPERFKTGWGTMGLVHVMNALLKNALKDETNKYFVFCSESCIPIFDFNKSYKNIFNIGKSWINLIGSPRGYEEMQLNKIAKHEQLGLEENRILKNEQWIILSREHAQIIVDHDHTENFKHLPIPDEWYHANVIRYYDNNFKQNFINRSLTYLEWERFSPKVFKSVESAAPKSDYLFLRKIDY